MSWGSIAGSLLSSYANSKSGGSSSGGGSSAWGNIFQAVLGGIGGSADAKLDFKKLEENIKGKGLEDRKTLDFTGQLEDYYKQQDKVRKRAALDTYGQFSLLDRYAPNMKPSAPVQMPTKPLAQ